MENSLTNFLEEFKVDRQYAISQTDLFKIRLKRRIKKFAIVDIEYFCENPELLEKAKKECYLEMQSIIERFEVEEEYELCTVVKDVEPDIEGIYAETLRTHLESIE